jgi:hypothetical protein
VHSDDSDNNTNKAANSAAANSGYASDSSIGAASGLSCSHKESVTPNSPTSDSPVSPGLGQFSNSFPHVFVVFSQVLTAAKVSTQSAS